MTSKLKCPFCGANLRESTYGIYSCTNVHCVQAYNYWGSPLLWQALIQAKQDLDFFIKEQVRTQTALIERTKELDKCQKDLKKANAELDYIKEQVEKHNALYNARKALEQTTHDNSEKANSVEHKEI